MAAVRFQAGLSRYMIAAMTGLSEQRISKIEKGNES